jgi:membrane glycosyltransferase
MRKDDLAVQRWLLLGLVVSTTAAASTRLLAIFRTEDITFIQIALLAVFAILFAWISTSFWIGCVGAHALWRGATGLPLLQRRGVPTATDGLNARTVLVMPVHNENSIEIFARLQAIWDSLRAAGSSDLFDLFVLSDSSDAGSLDGEQWEWKRFHDANPDARIFYRRRTRNAGHKSGNIAQFCENWGDLYAYMVVLDADSLMTGDTLVRLVRLMDANPRSALIQVAPVLVGGDSLFARCQQFASWVYGRVYATGLAKLQGPDGNYWGHNAIIRMRPFMDNCGLPVLPGRPPLGGEILSHDFVEAALLRRAGWEVWLATDIGGSYENSPPTLVEFLKRDRRWCQGNLQHIILMFAQGLRLPSRLHFALGAMSYLSSPLWLALVVLFVLNAVQFENAAAITYIGRYPVLAWPISHTVEFISLAVAAMALLYGPKLLALALLLNDRNAACDYGGRTRVILGVLLESVLSTLLAPIFMLSHSWFVLNILSGSTARWGAQLRGGSGIGFWQSARAFAPHTAVAFIVGAVAWYWTPADFWWYMPLLVGLSVAILLCWMTSNPRVGAFMRRRGLFLVPSETSGVSIVERYESLVAGRRTPACESDKMASGGTLQAA